MRRKGEYYCGATLITKKHILTAAHCTNGINSKEVEVVLSDHDRNSVERVIITRRVAALFQHKDFNKDTYNNDIAIMELDRPVQFSETVKAACIPNGNIFITIPKKLIPELIFYSRSELYKPRRHRRRLGTVR